MNLFETEVWTKGIRLNNKLEAEIISKHEAFEQSAIGREFYFIKDRFDTDYRNSFLNDYKLVKDELKISFTKNYIEFLKQSIFDQASFSQKREWDIPAEELLKYISFKTTEDLIHTLQYHLIQMFQGDYDLGWEEEVDQNIDIEENEPGIEDASKTINNTKRGRKPLHLSFDTLFTDIKFKEPLFSRLKQVGVLDENGEWIAGILARKDTRAMYEALVELKIMKPRTNKAALFRAFQEEFKIKGTYKNFNNPRDQVAIKEYVFELQCLVQ